MTIAPAIFALSETRAFGERVAAVLRVSLAAHEERPFEDGEHKTRPLVSVRGQDVFVIQSLHGDDRLSVNDKLCRLLFFLGALKDAAAERVTAVVPYLCYARKDRKTKTRDPVTTRYVAMMFEAVGVDRVVTMDVHNLAACQNAFRCSTEHLEERPLFVRHLLQHPPKEPLVVVSPDAGGSKRAAALRDLLSASLGSDVPLAFIEKRRSAGVVSGDALVGQVEGCAAVLIDDLISTGTTLVRAAAACRQAGAARVHALATHGVFTRAADEVLAGADAIESIVITSTVWPTRIACERARRKLMVLDAAPLVAQAIQHMHRGASVSELLETVPPVVGTL
jgi:ribose-phosphate pyrophosphokinase